MDSNPQDVIRFKKAHQRGHTQLDWLDSYHCFSFGDYYDPQNMGFRTLRVINDDLLSPAGGFDMHSHRDMEIITYVVEGQLAHKDSMGHGSIIGPGEFQKMSAGTGIKHSEFNPSSTQKTRFLQMWVSPDKAGLKPSYQAVQSKDLRTKDGLVLVASKEGLPGLIQIHQDVRLFLGVLSTPQKIDYEVSKSRAVWIQVVSGHVLINGAKLQTGDSACIDQEIRLILQSSPSVEFLLFDLG